MCVHACPAGIDVRLDATLAERNLAANSFDLALRKANVGSMSGAVKLFDETMQPVCSPFAARAGSASCRWCCAPPPTWLATLLHSLCRSDCRRCCRAVAGQGAAPGRRPLVDGRLTSGQLITPFNAKFASARAYKLIVDWANWSKP